ncbi:MAG TPA: aminoacyl-tRNA hydrolase [Clostridiaceae bacterium]|nr:aminoacyl-tRNA hydrolase [Clostridiaceae bacterium]
MYIIAGLGNPGKEYENTRHNTGFSVIDYIAQKNNINISKTKFKGIYGEGNIGNEKVMLLKPQTYMNLSGQSILDAVQFYKINVENLIVIYDDVSLPLGRIRIRPSGSDGGHNGIKSIIYLLETDCFPRLRVGIGEPGVDIINYVLGRFSSDEHKILDDVIKVAADGVEAIVNFGVDQAMNMYNGYKHELLLENE